MNKLLSAVLMAAFFVCTPAFAQEKPLVIKSGHQQVLPAGDTLDLSANPLNSNVTGSTQCLQANSAGVISGTGSVCGTGSGSGTVTSVTCGTGLSGGTITTTGTCSLTAPVTVALGGTNATSASGTALDNISGFASTGFLTRTGAGAYSFKSTTNGITLANLAQIGANTVLGNATASTANIATQSMPSCSAASSALTWTTNSGFGCNTISATGAAISGAPTAGNCASWTNATTIQDAGVTCGAGGGGSAWVFKTTSYTASAGDLLVCTGASSQTISLPASPSTGDSVAVRVALLGTYTNRVTVSGNGKTITGLLFTAQTSIGLGLEGQEVWFTYDGTVWRASSPGGAVLLTPKVADFSWINQGTATATDTAEGLLMTDPNSGVPSNRVLYAAVSGSFNVLTVLVEKSGAQGNFTNSGPLVMNSSAAFLLAVGQPASTWYAIRFSSATAASSFPINGSTMLGSPKWWQWKVSGSNIGVGYSENPAVFTQAYSEALSAFVTSITRVGISVDGGAAGNANTIFKHFHQE